MSINQGVIPTLLRNKWSAETYQ